MIEILLTYSPHRPIIPYHLYADGRNGNYTNAFGGGKKSNKSVMTGNKIYTARHPFNILTEEIYND